MTRIGPTCQEGWELPELLAYLEGELSEHTSRDLERHLRVCAVCSSEVESLRRLDRLLRSHPESFHPDAEELYRFVSMGRDSDAWISEHVASCPECREDVELVRHMIAAGAVASESRRSMPASLVRTLEAMHGLPVRGGPETTLLSRMAERFRTVIRPPVLALGTVAATLIVAMLLIPFLTMLPETPQPGGLPSVREPVSKAGSQAPFPEDHTPPLDTAGPKAKEAEKKTETGGYTGQHGAGIAARDARKLERGTIRGAGEPEEAKEPRFAPGKAMRKAGQIEKSSKRPESHAPLPAAPQQAMRAAPAKGALKEKQSAPRALQKAGIPVTVEILDSQGAAVPWLKFVVPQGLPDVFRFSDAPTIAPAEVTGTPSAEETDSVASREVAGEGLLIRFRVSASGEKFDVQAELFEPGAAQPKKTLTAAKVSREDLTNKIGSMAASLLIDGSTGDEFFERKE